MKTASTKLSQWPFYVGSFTIIILTTFVYSDTLNQRLLVTWDDIAYIYENSKIRSFSLENLIWMLTDYELGNWHPITWLSYAFNYTFWQHYAPAYKITNIIIHILNCFMLIVLSREILKKIFYSNESGNNEDSSTHINIASILAGVLFAIHPQHVESVTWIAERKDVLCTLFYLASIFFYIKYSADYKNSRWKHLSLILFLFALMSKPMAVSLPVILVLLDFYPLNKAREFSRPLDFIKWQLRDKFTFVLLSLLVSVITVITQREGIQGLDSIDTWGRIVNACMSLILYIFKFLLPINLSPLYPFHEWSLNPGIYSLIPVITILILTTVNIVLWRKNIRYPLLIWLFFIITLLPVIGIVKVGSQAAADRYTYIPMVGFYLLFGVLTMYFFKRIRNPAIAKFIVAGGSASIILIFTVLAYQQNTHWRNDETLWKRTISLYPGRASVPYSNLGGYYFRSGKYEASIAEYSKAFTVAPEDYLIPANIGKVYEKIGNMKLAESNYRKIIDLAPDSHRGYMELGDFFYRYQKLNLAKELYLIAYKKTPTIAATLQRAALVDFLNKNYAAAEKKLNYVLQLSPDDIGGLQLLAKVTLSQNKFTDARVLAEKILKLQKNDSFALDIISEINDRTDVL